MYKCGMLLDIYNYEGALLKENLIKKKK